MGAVSGLVFFILLFLFIPIPYWDRLTSDANANGSLMLDFPWHRFAQFIGGLLALLSMLFLGFADDILDIKWRVKIWMPLFASIPLLMVYYVTYGRTDVLVPIPLRHLFPSKVVPLGFVYYVYLACLCIFTTNSINILAGVNGVEGSQSLVIALSLVLNDLFQLYLNPAKKEAHLNSLYFLIPFIGVTLGYLRHNWYPARAFGGDTLCYFSGMLFSTVGILGNFSKTVLLFMIPQIFNFLYSCPQLFKFVDCPRHRMPKLNEQTGLIYASTFTMDEKTSRIGRAMVHFLATFRLVEMTPLSADSSQESPRRRTTRNSSKKDTKSVSAYTVSNLTLISLLLVKFGPMSERNTALAVIGVQIGCSLLAFTIRYGLVHIVYNDSQEE